MITLDKKTNRYFDDKDTKNGENKPFITQDYKQTNAITDCADNCIGCYCFLSTSSIVEPGLFLILRIKPQLFENDIFIFSQTVN